jgi:hypothetical protein
VRVIATVEATLPEMHPHHPELPLLLLSSVLDRDLGFDSLARMAKDLPMRPSSGSFRHEAKSARPMPTPGQRPKTRCWSVFAAVI